MTYSTEILSITGYQDEPAPHTFFKQDAATNHLAIILPGRGYTAQMPLLFYPTTLLLDRSADVLRVDYAYDRQPAFEALSFDQQLRWLWGDVSAAYRAGLSQRAYQRVTIIGKSLGTLAMGHLLTTETLPSRVNAVWLTPLVRFEPLRQQIKQFQGRSLFVIGTADNQYDPAILEDLHQATGGEVVIVEGADHGFNVKGDVIRSIQAVEQAVRAIQTFLD
jgi:hypothetical protein